MLVVLLQSYLGVGHDVDEGASLPTVDHLLHVAAQFLAGSQTPFLLW